MAKKEKDFTKKDIEVVRKILRANYTEGGPIAFFMAYDGVMEKYTIIGPKDKLHKLAVDGIVLFLEQITNKDADIIEMAEWTGELIKAVTQDRHGDPSLLDAMKALACE